MSKIVIICYAVSWLILLVTAIYGATKLAAMNKERQKSHLDNLRYLSELIGKNVENAKLLLCLMDLSSGLASDSIFKSDKLIYVDERKMYYQLDGINLIIEDGKLIGWYKP